MPIITLIFLCITLSADLVSVIILVNNLRCFEPLEREGMEKLYPRVDILVPARNEENNIEKCVESLLAQDYPDFTVTVLDDASTDNTPEILERLSRKDPRLKIMHGKKIGDNWQGKNWACHQLFDASMAGLILFTDADTIHGPEMLRLAVSALMKKKADCITVYPRQYAAGFWERAILANVFCVQLLYMAFFSKRRVNMNGQYMLFRRGVYENIGGHESIRNHLVDDMSLGRLMKDHGYSVILLNGKNHVTCRMYESATHAFHGFARLLFPSFDYRVLPFIWIWYWLGFSSLYPLVIMPFTVYNGWMLSTILSIACITITFTTTLFAFHRLGFNWWLFIVFPVTIVVNIIIAFTSLFKTISKRTTWKGRNMPLHKIRWA